MPTKRNNMFFDRGEAFMLSWILKIADTVNNLDDLKDRLKDLSAAKAPWITGCIPGFSVPTIEGCAIITHHYYVTVEDDKYVIMRCPKHHKINDLILWSDDTNTQCHIEFYGDQSTIDFIDSDTDFLDNVAKLINMPNDYEVTNKLKTVVIDDMYFNF